MQPYFFPYLGYYQLASKVDHFLFFDDAKMIKKGFVHRNSILSNGEAYRFTLPIKNISQNRNINEHFFCSKNDDFLDLIHRSYNKSDFFDQAFPLIQEVIKSSQNLSECCENSIVAIFKYIDKRISTSKTSEYPSSLQSQKRIIELCKIKNATHYYNPIGGKKLYDPIEFKNQGIELKFHKPEFQIYKQHKTRNKKEFKPALSIIDIIMNTSKHDISKMISNSSFENE